jgi:hypothetical protein
VKAQDRYLHLLLDFLSYEPIVEDAKRRKHEARREQIC